MTFLPYYCPTFRTEHLLEPCTKNLARVKVLREAKKHVGPIEKCVECKGKALIIKPRTVIEGLPAPENWVEKQFVVADHKDPFKPYRQDWNPNPEVTTAPLFLKDVKEAPVRDKSLEEGRLSTDAEAMVIHPAIPAREPNPEVARKVGHNLGKKYKKREKILPELPKKASDIVQAKPEVLEQRILEGKVPPKQEEIVPAVRITEEEAVRMVLAEAIDARYCPTHPKVIQHIDKLGRWMGMCKECLSARGKKCGLANFESGVTAPPISIPLNMPKYAEVKEWLASQAEENERTLQMQIMFILKMAWREGA